MTFQEACAEARRIAQKSGRTMYVYRESRLQWGVTAVPAELREADHESDKRKQLREYVHGVVTNRVPTGPVHDPDYEPPDNPYEFWDGLANDDGGWFYPDKE